MEKMQSTALMVQTYFDEILLIKLVECGALTKESARDIAVSTAEFAHELADEPGRAEYALAAAAGFERLAASLAN